MDVPTDSRLVQVLFSPLWCKFTSGQIDSDVNSLNTMHFPRMITLVSTVNMAIKNYSARTLSILCALAIAPSAFAQDDYAKFNAPWNVYIGGFWPSTSSEVAINGELLPPRPPTDVEDALGIDDNAGVAWGGIRWHFAERHSLELEAFSLKRNGGASGVFSPPIEVGDYYLESGAVATSYDTSLTRLTYGYSLIRRERTHLQVSAGLHVAKLGAGIQLSGEICSPNTVPTTPPGCPTAGSEAASEDVTAPLPHFGLSYAYAMTPSLDVSVQAIGFAITVGSIEGSIVEMDADLSWQPFQNIGFGAGFRYFNTNVKASNSQLNGEFDFEYFGPVLSVKAAF